jgi:hypothetical protein
MDGRKAQDTIKSYSTHLNGKACIGKPLELVFTMGPLVFGLERKKTRTKNPIFCKTLQE